MTALFALPARTTRYQLERIERRLAYKYRDHSTAQTFSMRANRPLAPAAQEPMFDTLQVQIPPQKETLI